MNLCADCLTELFDFDHKCSNCNSTDIIFRDKYEEIKNELFIADNQARKRLIRVKSYKAVYDDLAKKGGYHFWESLDGEELGHKKNNVNLVTCPYCQSTNTSKISNTSKFINTAVWGIFGTKRHKQWHCNDCGSDF